jgi:hypothetical protein
MDNCEQGDNDRNDLNGVFFSLSRVRHKKKITDAFQDEYPGLLLARAEEINND